MTHEAAALDVYENTTGTVVEVLDGGRRLCIDMDGRYPVRFGDRVEWEDATDRIEWDNDGMRVNVRRLGQPYEAMDV